MAARKAITQAQLDKWPKATKVEKSVILDGVCGVTGWHRDHACKVIRTALAQRRAGGPPARGRREPVLTYGQDGIDLLTRCWAVLDGPTGKRLQPALPGVLANLARHGHLDGIDPQVIALVQQMSAATIDRRLTPARIGLVAGKGISHTRPGSLLKSSIPMKTWHEWDESIPGIIQIDLVGHDGGDANGHFHYSLDATDVATGWTETITVRSKGERIVASGLEQLWLRFPFHISGIHSDNGSEFINHHLLNWCTSRKINFSRGRASHSNDQAHIEQKNPRPDPPGNPAPRHRHRAAQIPDHRHPGQPARTRPPPRPGPTPSQTNHVYLSRTKLNKRASPDESTTQTTRAS